VKRRSEDMPAIGTGVAAVNRCLCILEAFTESESELTLSELAHRTGFYKSTLLRLASSLEKFNYIRRADSGAYRLGSEVLRLGLLYQRHFPTFEIVPAALQAIASEVREGASFYVCEGDERVCLHRVDSARTVRDSVHEGSRLPLSVGAASHVLLAFKGARGKRYDTIRQLYFAESYGERDPETAAVACPVFGPERRLVGALSVSGPRYRIHSAGAANFLPTLFKQARLLTHSLDGDRDVFPRSTRRFRPSTPAGAHHQR